VNPIDPEDEDETVKQLVSGLLVAKNYFSAQFSFPSPLFIAVS